MKKILIIGSGWEQLELVSQAKKMGLYVIATHPALNTDGFAIADRHYIRSADNIRAHLDIAQKHQVSAVVSDNCDYSYFTAALVASKMGLPFSSIESALCCVDKTRQRMKCKSDPQISQPAFQEVQTYDEYDQVRKQIGFPYIVKPVDSRGTFGVTIVRAEKDIEDAYYHAVMNSPSKRIICEEFIEGVLVTVDGFCFSNGHRSLAVASRVYDEGPHPVTNEINYPAEFPAEINQSLLENHDLVVDALGFTMGHTHGEYILTPAGEMFLVECTNRGGGVYTSSSIVPYLTDINLNEILIKQSLGEDSFEIEEKDNYMNHSAILAFLNLQAGRVIQAINTDELQELEYVLKLRCILGKNDMVETIENCASRHMMLVIKGETLEESKKNFDDFKSKLNVSYYT